MRLALCFLFAVSAQAQITLQGGPIGGVFGGLIDYYAAHPDLAGDTNLCILSPITLASGGSGGTHVLNLNDGAGDQTISGKLICTFNDGNTKAGSSRNIGFYNVTKLDMSSAANTAFADLNSMDGYGTGAAHDTPTGWAGQGTTGQGTDYSWKSGHPIAVNGWILLPILRQTGPAFFQGGDSTIIASPDGGLHWCNPYTYANHSGSPGCDSANWSATGDAPLPPSHGSYTATPSSIMWKDVTPYNGSTNRAGRLYFFNYCQNNSCTGSPHNADTYLYAFASNGRQTANILGRVAKNINSIMDVTAWKWYTCTGYKPDHVCDGMDDANWTSTLANATMLFTGDGAIANGDGTSINPTPNGYTEQHGQQFGSPLYYTANGVSAYVQTFFKDYLQDPGLGHSDGKNSIMAFPTPWGPFGPNTSERYNILFGFWSLLRYTIQVPDSKPGHAVFVGVGDNYDRNAASTVYFQPYELTLGANQNGSLLAGCSQYRLTWGSVAGAITRNGLWAFFDFFSHGCYNNHRGNLYDTAIYSTDISRYPATKQLIGCITDAGAQCGNPNPGHNLIITASGAYIDGIYAGRFELRDTVPGVYNSITAHPLTTSSDPLYSVGFIIKPTDIAQSNQGLLEAGAAQPNSTLIYTSLGTSGNICIVWGYPTRLCTTSAVLSNETWAYVVVTRSGTGAPTACAALPCTNNTHIWVNGVERTTTLTTGGTNPNISAGPFTVGTIAGNTSFFGWLAGAEIYSRALSQREIYRQYKTHQAMMLRRGVTLP